MPKKQHKFIALLVAILVILLMTSPVMAIANPNAIDFGTGTIPLYKVFENVLETGDMLFVAEQYVHYVAEPSDYTASEAFLFEVLDVAGVVTLLSTPLNEYENKPISIYQTASEVVDLGLVSGTAYVLRITGNPIIFGAPAGNTVTAALAASDYVDQLLGVDGGDATANPLRNFLILMAENIEANDSPAAGYEYIEPIQGIRYLTIIGGDIFIQGIPALGTMCPILFQTSLTVMTSDAPESTGTYALTLTPLQKWGATTANGLTQLGNYLGISQALAGSVVLFAIVIAFAVYIYMKTQSGIAALLLVAACPFFGAFMGLMPIALAFIFTIVIIVLMGYFFFSRGAL